MLYLHDITNTDLSTGDSTLQYYEGVIAHTMRLTMPWHWGSSLQRTATISYAESISLNPEKLLFGPYNNLVPSFNEGLGIDPDFSGLAIGGINYIYETCSSLFSGSLNKYYVGDALNSKLS